MEATTLWWAGIENEDCPKLKESVDTDVLIIGAGITGISAAYHLRNSGLKVTVVDKDLVGHGVTSKTTGKLTYLQELIYTKLQKNFTNELVKMYLQSQKEAINIVANIVDKNTIDCDFERVDSYIFTNESKEINKIKKEKELLEMMDVSVREYSNLPVQGISSKYAIAVDNTAVFHPIKYLMALKNICIKDNVCIYEHTNITNIVKKDGQYLCKTPLGCIKCSKIILACHYPFFLLPLFFPLKGHLERSYLSASIINRVQTLSAINTSAYSKSLRYHSDKNNSYFIYLNGSHVIENKINETENFQKLNHVLEKMKLSPKYMWSNHDIITNDYLPYIGCINSGDNTFLIGTGYNTWGMTNGSIAGKILSDIILEQENHYIPLFDPHRRKGIYNLLSIPVNIYCSAKPFIENKLIKNKSWYTTNIKVKKTNGKSVAIYKDSKGVEHKIYNKCPHMGCSLVFNDTEKTWDCPCHGSRFDIDGKCIQGPSCYNISCKHNYK